jgi:hypothetical protein
MKLANFVWNRERNKRQAKDKLFQKQRDIERSEKDTEAKYRSVKWQKITLVWYILAFSAGLILGKLL